jgi:hypothetical protein
MIDRSVRTKSKCFDVTKCDSPSGRESRGLMLRCRTCTSPGVRPLAMILPISRDLVASRRREEGYIPARLDSFARNLPRYSLRTNHASVQCLCRSSSSYNRSCATLLGQLSSQAKSSCQRVIVRFDIGIVHFGQASYACFTTSSTELAGLQVNLLRPPDRSSLRQGSESMSQCVCHGAQLTSSRTTSPELDGAAGTIVIGCGSCAGGAKAVGTVLSS